MSKPGIWIQMFVWSPVRYDKIVLSMKYKQVQVFCEDGVIADIPVVTYSEDHVQRLDE